MSETQTLLSSALDQRVRAAADGLGVRSASDAPDTGTLLEAMVRGSRDARSAWLILVALAGAFPTRDEVRSARRSLQLQRPADATVRMLEIAGAMALAHGSAAARLEVVTDSVVVDVGGTVGSERHTGIQRVVGEVVPRWLRDHTVTLVTWHSGWPAMCRLDPASFGMPAPAEPDTDSEPPVVLAPWRSTVIMPDVPANEIRSTIACLAAESHNDLAAVGYDTIPITSADLRPWEEPNYFIRYFDIVKHCTRVAAISASAGQEFQGFADTLRPQGLHGPTVLTVPLAQEPVQAPDARPETPPVPSVLCVGSLEIHKNHLAVLHAAELAWREGHEFTLTLVGRPGWDVSEIDGMLARLRGDGRPVTVLSGLDDAGLAAAYRAARFVAFPSLHEGFGLPIVEALAVGTPVLTSNRGSMAEIARAGGCLLVDPEDDKDLLDGFRRLLTDDELLGRLRVEALARPTRTWETYAGELWDALTRGAA